MDALVEMYVHGLGRDVAGQMVVELWEKGGNRALPIVVGQCEWYAILMRLGNKLTPRPMTHDLMKNLLDELQAEVTRVVVCDLSEDVFYALISLSINGTEKEVDARPSDAIALALRTDAPVYVAEQVLERAGRPIEERADPQEEKVVEERFNDLVSDLDLEQPS